MGVSEAGFMMTLFPAHRAGATLLVMVDTG